MPGIDGGAEPGSGGGAVPGMGGGGGDKLGRGGGPRRGGGGGGGGMVFPLETAPGSLGFFLAAVTRRRTTVSGRTAGEGVDPCKEYKEEGPRPRTGPTQPYLLVHTRRRLFSYKLARGRESNNGLETRVKNSTSWHGERENIVRHQTTAVSSCVQNYTARRSLRSYTLYRVCVGRLAKSGHFAAKTSTVVASVLLPYLTYSSTDTLPSLVLKLDACPNHKTTLKGVTAVVIPIDAHERLRCTTTMKARICDARIAVGARCGTLTAIPGYCWVFSGAG